MIRTLERLAIAKQGIRKQYKMNETNFQRVTTNKMFLRLALLSFVLALSLGDEASHVGWHQKFGILEAERIRTVEESYFVTNNKPIVGGTIAAVNAHPHLAGIVIDVVGIAGPSACGGSLITSSRVLTAAHCWNDGRFQAWRFTVVLGSPYLFFGGTRIVASAIAIHPNYNAYTLANDIAMLYLPAAVQFSDVVRPAALPSGSLLSMDFTGFWTMAAGYGRYSDLTNPSTNTMVRQVFLQVISPAQCSAVYGKIIQDSNICTSGSGGVGICQGDSGGPLTLNVGGQQVLIGVSSFVARDGCELGYPSAFASVPRFIDWIQMHI